MDLAIGHYTEPPTEVAPMYYTLGVNVGEEQRYTVNRLFRMYPNGTNVSRHLIHLVGNVVQEGEEFLVKITGISSKIISHDILTNLSNGNFTHITSREVSRMYYIFPYDFITTTNHTVLEHKLNQYKPEVIQFNISEKKLNYTRTGWDYGWKTTNQHICLYDLTTGWLLADYFKAWNKTHIILEYEI